MDKPQKKIKIAIAVRGGVVIEVQATEPVDVNLVDFDNLTAEKHIPKKHQDRMWKKVCKEMKPVY